MHRKLESDLSSLDTELERTLRNLRKVKEQARQLWQMRELIRQSNKRQQ